MERLRPGQVRDAVVRCLAARGVALTVTEIRVCVESDLGVSVPASSVRSYLGLNTGALFERTERGRYRLK